MSTSVTLRETTSVTPINYTLVSSGNHIQNIQIVRAHARSYYGRSRLGFRPGPGCARYNSNNAISLGPTHLQNAACSIKLYCVGLYTTFEISIILHAYRYGLFLSFTALQLFSRDLECTSGQIDVPKMMLQVYA